MRCLLAITTLLISSLAFAEPAKVAVLPLEQIGENGKSNWVAKAIQQSLSDELAQMPGIEVVAPTTQPAPARFTVAGRLQHVDRQLRVTGQVVDAVAQKSVGGFKATASERELFGLEDSVAEQVKLILRAQIPEQPASPVAIANNPPLPVRPRQIFEGSDLQRALNNPRPLRPEPRVVPVTPPYYFDDGPYAPLYRSYVSYPYYPFYPTYPICYRPKFFHPCFTSTFFVSQVKITSHANDYSRGSGLVPAYPQLTANFVPRNHAIGGTRISNPTPRVTPSRR